MTNKALYAGSFDPVTRGHLDIIKRATLIFEKVIVGIAVNTRKKPLFTAEQRVQLLEQATIDLAMVTATCYKGMTVDYARVIGATTLIRGMRNTTDFQLEFQMALTNRALAPDLETVFFTSSPPYTFINSFLVREVVKSGGDVSPFVPEEIVVTLAKMLEYNRAQTQI